MKPNNILLEVKDKIITVFIIDLGLAIKKENRTYMFPKCGTPGYVAPEIVNLIDHEY